MKQLLSILTLFAMFFSETTAELTSSQIELQEEYEGELTIQGVKDDDWEDDNDNEFFVLKFESSQEEKHNSLKLQMRVTVKLIDKKTKSVVFAKASKNQGKVKGNYSGSHEWECKIPYGQMKRPKLEAYAVEFGIVDGSTFIPVATDYDGVESAEEILSGEGTEITMTIKGKAAPNDAGGGEE